MLGTRSEAVGRIWHVPNAPGWMIGLAGLFNPQLRELKEMLYEFDRDFVVDSTQFEAAFGIRATPLEAALTRTLAWFRDEASNPT